MKKVYVTLLSNRRYLEGVVILNQSLIESAAKYPLVCMLSSDVSCELEDELKSYGINVRRLDESMFGTHVNDGREAYRHWSFTFDKLRVFGLTEFEKVVFLDSDMIVRNNIDHLFELPPMSAAVAGAALFGWTKLNSGLMVITPDDATEQALLELAPTVIDDFRSRQLSVGDQDVIQAYYPHWEDDGSLLLDEGYNMVADWLITYIRKFGYSWNGKQGSPINVVHFIGHTKPWTPKSLREKIWVMKTSLRNPYFFLAYRQSHALLRRAKRKKKQIETSANRKK